MTNCFIIHPATLNVDSLIEVCDYESFDFNYREKMTMNEDITIILPCAGEGSRLGLEYPKELYEIFPGKRLIDFSLEHIRVFPNPSKLTVTVVTRPWKTEVSDYISERLADCEGLRVNTVMFNAEYKEWPGSVYSAKSSFSKYNIVLLPDSYLSLSPGWGGSSLFNEEGKGLIELMNEALWTYEVVFGAIECSDGDILKKLGAMRIQNGLVREFQDKPIDSLELYNSFWGCYGFRQDVGYALYEYLIQTVQHCALPINSQIFFPPGVINVGRYIDLGTWENIDYFRGIMQPIMN